nr:MAG TPA: hypothetical protein [Caudoviricetes sp.]
MFFLAASFFSASYNADGILIFNALSFTFSPPLQFYYNHCRVSIGILHKFYTSVLSFFPILVQLQSGIGGWSELRHAFRSFRR